MRVIRSENHELLKNLTKSDPEADVLPPVDFGSRFSRIGPVSTLDSDSEESLEEIVPRKQLEQAIEQKTDNSHLEFNDVDFVIEQIENLPKANFGNGAVIYEKRGKRKLLKILQSGMLF